MSGIYTKVPKGLTPTEIRELDKLLLDLGLTSRQSLVGIAIERRKEAGIGWRPGTSYLNFGSQHHYFESNYEELSFEDLIDKAHLMIHGTHLPDLDFSFDQPADQWLD